MTTPNELMGIQDSFSGDGSDKEKRTFKILFLYPNFQMAHLLLPAGVSMLSAVLKQEGFETRLFDTTLYKPQDKTFDDVRLDLLQIKKVTSAERTIGYKETDLLEDFVELLNEYEPDLLGVSLLQDTAPIAAPLIDAAHERGVPVLVGGIYPTFAPDDMLKEESVDMVCLGEGENAIVTLCERMSRGQSYDDIPNLYVKKPNGTVIRNQMGPTVNINELPLPDYDLFEPARFFRPMQGRLLRILPIEMHRGCPYQCAFCEDPIQSRLYRAIGEVYHRAKDPKRLIEELKVLVDKYEAEYIYFNAETFFAMPERDFVEMAHLYAEEVGLPFWMQTRPETLTKKHIDMLVMMNVANVNIGLEHGNEEFRAKVLKRKMKNSLIIDGLRNLHEAGISTTVNNIMGFPDETRELVFDTIELNRHIQSATINAYLFNPYKGTELYEVCKQKGYLPEQDTDETRVIDAFLSEDFPYFKTILKMQSISREELQGLQRTFVLYAKLPRSEFPRIRVAEQLNDEGDEMFHALREEYLGGEYDDVVKEDVEA